METKRSCGECTLCCKALPVEAIDKPGGEWCRHCDQQQGCRIYAERPRACQDFNCLWLHGALTEEDRPDKIGIVLWTSPENARTYSDGRRVPFLLVSERHDGCATKGLRSRAIIRDALQRGGPVAIAKGTTFKVLALQNRNILIEKEVERQQSTDVTVERRPESDAET